jgi:hypothetical protein
MKREPRALKRDERKEQIMNIFAEWKSKGDDEPKTMNRIAKALDMIPSHAITTMLLELVEDGKLGFVKRQKFGRWEARAYYSTVKTLITEKYGKRRIAVKYKGVERGQLELWS